MKEEECVTVLTADGHQYHQPLKKLRACRTIDDLMQDVGGNDTIPLSEVSTQDLEHLLRFIRTGRVDGVPPEELPKAMHAVNYLQHDGSLEAYVERSAELIREIPFEQLCRIFNVKQEEVDQAVDTWF
jgi:hypothetical protein